MGVKEASQAGTTRIGDMREGERDGQYGIGWVEIVSIVFLIGVIEAVFIQSINKGRMEWRMEPNIVKAHI